MIDILKSVNELNTFTQGTRVWKLEDLEALLSKLITIGVNVNKEIDTNKECVRKMKEDATDYHRVHVEQTNKGWVEADSKNGRYVKADSAAVYADTSISDKNDPVNHPAHYTSHPSGIECIEITRHMSFNIGNATKYLWRCGKKVSPNEEVPAKMIEELQKAIWYINDEIKLLKGEK